MKEHFCPVEKTTITYQGKCNWCGESEGGMTQDEIIEMAIENTINGLNFNQEGLVRFANLVAAKEREACAKVCESEGIRIDASYLTCAEAIRARGEQA